MKVIADGYTLYAGDCVQVLRTLPACSVDAICTDPPAGIAFMGKEWDKDKGGRDAWIAWLQEVAAECYRVIRPGGHALVWALPRTSHWTGMAWENAGWEPRDKIVHIFGSGFPKSLNVGGGLGTALKPASEDWWLFRKPLDGTVAANVLKHGTGAINIDGCRVEGGRFPANVITDGSDEVEEVFPQNIKGGTWNKTGGARHFNNNGKKTDYVTSGSDATIGSASRFFYCAKANKRDRDEGLDGMPEVAASGLPMRSAEGERGGVGMDGTATDRDTKYRNTHPTVKNVNLMRYLVRLITPKNGICLDPFMGSGSTGKGCAYEGFGFIGIELDPHFVEVAEKRILYALANPPSQDEAPEEVTRQLIKEAPVAPKRKRGRPPKHAAQISIFDKNGEKLG